MQTDRLSLDGPSTQTNSILIGSPQTAHFRACALADPTVNTSTAKRTKNARILTLAIGKADASLHRHKAREIKAIERRPSCRPGTQPHSSPADVGAPGYWTTRTR